MNLIWLIFAHYIGDFALQSEWIAQNKSKYWYILFSHCMIWTAIMSATLQYFDLLAWWKLIFLFTGHWLADGIKGQFYKSSKDYWMIYPDQLWHLIQCVVVWYF